MDHEVDSVGSFEERPPRQSESTNPFSNVPRTIAKELEDNPNSLLYISSTSFVLGNLFALGALTFVVGGIGRVWWATYQLGFFVAAWAAFHFGEFATTAGWNTEKCTVDSFLLNNGRMYHIAHSVAAFEYLATLYLAPSLKTYPYVSTIGVLFTVFGQVLRSTAMIHASTNFSHLVARYKVEGHKLVTTGVYGWFRHPSYAGFFYWALGTQLVLQNPLSFVFYFILLWRFFFYRIRAEENFLIRFFGKDYTSYRAKVGTKIPFIW